MGMLETGDELGFGLEPMDEPPIVGKLRTDQLDRNFTAHRPLIRPIHHTRHAGPDPLPQFEPAHARPCAGR